MKNIFKTPYGTTINPCLPSVTGVLFCSKNILKPLLPLRMTPEQKDLTKRAQAKWLNKTISGPRGTYFVSVVYWRSEGYLEALLFPKEGGMPETLKLIDMKREYVILD